MTKAVIDVESLRRQEIAFHGLHKADERYTLYYDETNNIRRLVVRADGLNVPSPKCFVIGGIGHRGASRALDIASLRAELRIQANAPELKFKHIAHGEFVDVLGSSKLEGFLGWISSNDLFVHYSVLDPLYWSIVDIIDSILAEAHETPLLAIGPDLKNDLYSVLRVDHAGTVDLFARFNYPDVGSARRREFVEELLELTQQREQLLDHFGYQMLKGVLQIGRDLDSLPFLEHEAPNVLIAHFAPFYEHRIWLLKNSEHILDTEETVEAKIRQTQFMDGGMEIRSYRFSDSHGEPGIQVSDLVCGLLGKFFSFICLAEAEELEASYRELNEQQLRNLALLAETLDRSIEENPIFANYVLSLEDQHRAAMWLQH